MNSLLNPSTLSRGNSFSRKKNWHFIVFLYPIALWIILIPRFLLPQFLFVLSIIPLKFFHIILFLPFYIKWFLSFRDLTNYLSNKWISCSSNICSIISRDVGALQEQLYVLHPPSWPKIAIALWMQTCIFCLCVRDRSVRHIIDGMR